MRRARAGASRPPIDTAILEGHQPVDLNLKRLMYRTDLSIDWSLQRQQLGFEAFSAQPG